LIPVIWHLSNGWWDTALPKFILSGVPICEIVGFENVAIDAPLAVLMIPGRHSLNDYDRINICSRRFDKVVFFVYGDEEGAFDLSRLDHPRKRIWWAMPPYVTQHPDMPLINGWPSEAPALIAQHATKDRVFDWSFMGQVTHSRREQCVAALRDVPFGCLLKTPGFTQGVPRNDYYTVLAQSKLVPCPSGPCTPDSFRFAEALEAGCIPIADDLTPKPEYPQGYWRYTLGVDCPIPVIQDWSLLPDLMAEWLKDWEEKSAVCQAWWKEKKRYWIRSMREDLQS